MGCPEVHLTIQDGLISEVFASLLSATSLCQTLGPSPDTDSRRKHLEVLWVLQVTVRCANLTPNQ